MKERNEIMRFFGLHPQNDVRRKFAFTLAEGATHVGNSNNKCKFAFTLAEGATHVDNSNNKRRFAFTLAEVLVTLGIIGVVAVLTVPNIISSYQKKVYVAQLQKAYNQLQQVFSLAMAEDEVEYLADTELMQSINGDYIGASDDQSAFSSKLGEYMKIQKACQPYDYDDGCHDIYYTNLDQNYESSAGERSNRGGDLQVFTKDGMVYYFHMIEKNANLCSEEEIEYAKQEGLASCSWHAKNNWGILIDVNGKKGPNKFGRDLFRFALDNRGQIYPYGSIATSGKYFDWSVSNGGCASSGSYGFDCGGRIMDQGWKMDY